MSVGIAVQCSDGIILAADTQALLGEPEMVRANDGKAYVLADHVAMVGAGTSAHVRYLSEEIGERLPEYRISKKEFRYLLENAVLELHERYNLNQPPLSKVDTEDRYDVSALVAARVHEGEFIYKCTKDGTVEPVDDHASIGSGCSITEYVLQKIYRDDIQVEKGFVIATYAILESIQMDPGCGGQVWIGAFTKDTPFRLINGLRMKKIESAVKKYNNVLNDCIFNCLSN